jgi:hypothetical protein
MPGPRSRVGWSRGMSLAAAALLVTAVTCALYGASLSQPFTGDDYQYLHGCQQLKGQSLLSVFHPAVQGVVLPPFYRPTSVAFFLALIRLSGLQPLPFHIWLFGLRLITLLLALILFSRLFERVGWGAVAAVILAVSPFGVEPGVWSAAVPDAFLGLALFGALVCFDQLGRWEAHREKAGKRVTPHREVGWGWCTAVVVCGLFALASKEPAIVLPFLLLCLPGRSRALGRTTIALLLAADGLYLLLRLWMHTHMPPPPEYDYWHLLRGPRDWAWWNQLALSGGLLLTGPFVVKGVLYFGLVILVTAILFVARSHRGISRSGLVLALLLLLPLAITGGLASPRYGYVPAMGVAMIITALARLGWRGKVRWLTGATLLIWILFQADFSRFCIAEWGRSADASAETARFLVTRPSDEETVLLWIPYYGVGSHLGLLWCKSYALNDSIYPSHVKELFGNGAQAVPLTLVDRVGHTLPETLREEADIVELRGDRDLLEPARPSVYTGRVTPDIRVYADLLAQERSLLRFRLKRAPHRAFFPFPAAGWLPL